MRANWNRNKILSIRNDCDVTVTGQKQVAEVVIDYFKNKIGANSDRANFNLDLLDLPCVPEISVQFLKPL